MVRPADRRFDGEGPRWCPRGEHLSRALELAERLAASPQPTLRSDRRAVLEGARRALEHGLALGARLGRDVLATGVAGAARFAGGEGRRGT